MTTSIADELIPQSGTQERITYAAQAGMPNCGIWADHAGQIATTTGEAAGCSYTGTEAVDK